MQHRRSRRGRREHISGPPQAGGPPTGPDRPGGRGRPQDTYPLPQDTCELAQSYANQSLNYGLRLDRLLPCNAQTWELTRQAKERFASQVNGRKVLEFRQSDLSRLIKEHKTRWEAMLNDYREHGYEVRSFAMHAASRVIVGLGAESVLETSIRLHRIYGFPIIPGSALKGLARSYAKLVEGKDETDATFAAVFGKSPPDASAGQVIFFDAVPADPQRLQLDLDVMNPHYSQYYQGGNTPPADYLNPIPVFFLAIAPDSKFLFAVASREPGLAQQAQSWLQAGLQKMGIGAKTTAGYGLWESQQHQTIAPTSESIEETREDSEREKKPDSPEPIERITPRIERIPAQVLDNSRNPIRVRLLAKGYENEVFECYGVRNLSSFPPGTYIWVRISEFDKKRQRIRKVSLAALWRP